MANKIFYIPGLNGLRWVQETITLESDYNTLPADSEIDEQNYAAPIQSTDTNFPVLICLSDYPDMLLEFFVSATGALIATPTLEATDSSVIGETFKQYIAYVNFSSFPIGWCYARVSYIDDNNNYQSWITCPIDVEANHPCTQLFQYQNSYNTESVLFHPAEIILKMRVESNMIGGYQPKSNLQTMDDQPDYSPVLLNGFNYDIYTNYIGGPQVPDWVIKKYNLIFAKCDQVKIDYEFYVAAGDFKVDRPNATRNRNGMWERDLQIVPGYQFGQLTAGITPTGDLIVVRKTWPLPPFPSFTASFVVNGVFTQYTTLDYLQTINPDLATFILKLGTTVGANDILETEIGTPNADESIDLVEVHTFRKGLNAATNIYCTLPDSVNIKAIFAYDQLDAPPLNLPTPGGAGLPQGTVAYYKELVAGYFTRDWDIATGLGQVGSLYEGCQILDEAAGKVLVGWDRTTTDPDAGRGTPGVSGSLSIGNPGNEVTVARENLPTEGLFVFADAVNNTDSDFPRVNNRGDTIAFQNEESISRKNYSILRATTPAARGVTENLGAGTSLYIGNDGLIMLCYVKL